MLKHFRGAALKMNPVAHLSERCRGRRQLASNVVRRWTGATVLGGLGGPLSL
jgi:hypothetical protein